MLYSWAQLDELVIYGYGLQAISRLEQMDASSRERMLVAGVKVLVGEAAVLLPGVGAGGLCNILVTLIGAVLGNVHVPPACCA